MPPYNQIKIAVLSLDIVWNDIERNIKAVLDAIAWMHPDTDILVLPELFSTGFIQDRDLLKEITEKQTDRVLVYLKRLSSTHHIAIAGSMLAKDNDNLYNRGFFVEPTGEITCYDKRHLFCLSPESNIFSAGKLTPPVIRYRGWNISMVICYDLRFPVWCRNKKNNADILIVPANWPMSRSYAWEHLLIARAIENQCIVVGANRSGEDDYGKYSGLSYIFDATGHVIASSSAQRDRHNVDIDIIYTTYTKEELDKTRKKLPFGNDADDFTIYL
ncbi:MAG: nitrilase family protein [Bacteroidales bacterium]|nr:nitrilase family protein [Bacteroidales bacterium]